MASILEKLGKYQTDIESNGGEMFTKNTRSGRGKQQKKEDSMSVICFKRLLFVLNLVFLIFGIALVGLGVTAMRSEVLKLAHGDNVSMAILAVGILIIVMSCLGFCGVFTFNNYVLALYGFLLVLMLIVQITVTSYAYTHESNMQKMLLKEWNKSDDATKNALQDSLSCCGFSTFGENAGSVCPAVADDACYPHLKSQLAGYSNAIRPCMVLVLIVEIAAVITAWILRRLAKSSRYRKV